MFFTQKKLPITKLFPPNYTDLHCHIVPGIDDGAKTIEESLDLLRRYENIGIKKLIATPHIMAGVYPNTTETIKEHHAKLLQAAEEAGINIKIGVAAEYMLDGEFEALLKEKDLLTLKDNYLLVEMSYLNPPVNLFELLFKLQQAGYEPVLAHPERYAFLHDDREGYRKLKHHGCLFQLNLLSLSDHYGKSVKKAAVKLLKEGMIDFTGTDTHHKGHLKLLETLGTRKNRKLLESVLSKNIKL